MNIFAGLSDLITHKIPAGFLISPTDPAGGLISPADPAGVVRNPGGVYFIYIEHPAAPLGNSFYRAERERKEQVKRERERKSGCVVV